MNLDAEFGFGRSRIIPLGQRSPQARRSYVRHITLVATEIMIVWLRAD